MQGFTEINHHGVGVRRIRHADIFSDRFVLSPAQLAELVCLRRGHATQGVAIDVLRRCAFSLLNKNLFVIRHGSHRIAEFLSLNNDIR